MNEHSDVSVVVTTYNHAHFLGEALASITAQTQPAKEVIVVDDGSHDDPAAVVRDFPGVQIIRQDNRGLSAARNAGLHAAVGAFILFLDADDRLLPDAIASGLDALADHPEALLVYGAHRRIDEQGRVLGGVHYVPALAEPWGGMLRGNRIGMHATILYRRAALLATGGFDETLRRCEDYDLYLRLAAAGPLISHPRPVADYRQHRTNMSADFRAMCRTALAVHARYRPGPGTPGLDRLWREGRVSWRSFYAHASLYAPGRTKVKRLAMAARIAPLWTARRAGTEMLDRIRNAARRLRFHLAGGRNRGSPPLGAVDMGDLASAIPISDDFGWDRGQPIDRFYIERFLAHNAGTIQGRALEIGDASYCRAFGGDRITRQDVLHAKPVPDATIVGDLATPDTLPAGVFDVIVFTQTIQFIYDTSRAIRQLHEALKPGGTLLITAPGITPIDRKEWRESWYWSFTEASLSRLLGAEFGPAQVTTSAHGNVYAATCFLQGMVVEDVQAGMLELFDPAYPVILTGIATRAGG